MVGQGKPRGWIFRMGSVGTAWRPGSMMMSVLAMHMAMRDLVGAGGAHARHLDGEAQRDAGPGVVAVEHHLVALDLHHVEDVRLAAVQRALQLAAHLHARRE